MAFFMNSFKYIIFLVNLIFFGLGCYLLYALWQQMGSDFYNLTYENLKSPIYVSFIISAIIVLISFLGCCGTCNENPCMIKAYAGLILLCVILQVAVIVMLLKIDPTQIKQQIKKNVIEKFQEEKQWQKSIQIIQQEHSCCGIDSYSDYFKDKTERFELLPDSCCGKFIENNSTSDSIGHCLNKRDIFGGCGAEFVNLFKENSKPIYIIIGCVFGLQLLVVILSCALSKNIREQYNVV